VSAGGAGQDVGTGRQEEVATADVLVVGAGAAGLTAALGCVARRVVVLTKTSSTAAGAGGASVWAQGGVASAVGDDDAPALHAADTLAVGAGLNDAAIVDLLTGEGPRRIRSLLALGARFDREPGGRLALGREAAHSRRRILHAHGDATGAEVVRTLVEAVRREPAIRVVDETFALDLVLEGGTVVGLTALHGDGRRVLYRAPAVVLATGGLGQLFLYTTNPREATADGLAMAARAGARLVDLEFVQFHPTALAPTAAGSAIGAAVGRAPLPLLTEALRGEGAVLIDDRGVRFMTAVHPDRELAPRDVVARAIWARLSAGRQIYLDARHAVGERFPERFPTVFALCRQHGIDPRVERMPVVPAAHYHMGGVAVDANGRTSLPGLWACGEVAATGAHGANRLASNSLLEALVFGARVAEDVAAAGEASGKAGEWRGADGRGDRGWARGRQPAAPTSARAWAAPALDVAGGDAAELVVRLQRLMWARVGVERSGAGLSAAAAELAVLSRRAAATAGGFAAGEARNLLLAGRLLAQAALARRESRGGHYRADFPRADAAWQRRRFLTVTAGGAARFEPWEEEAAAAEPRRPAPAAVEQLL
jgi:L-aspartate oxidase